MEINVNIDKDAVEQQVVNAIMASAIGEQLQVAINKALTTAGPGYGGKTLVATVVDQVLLEKIREIANQIIESKKEEMRTQIANTLTDEVISKMSTAVWAVMIGRLGKVDDRY